MTLRLRLTLLVVGLTVLLLAGLGAVVAASVERWATEVVDAELTRRAEVLRHELEFDDGAFKLDDDDDLDDRGLAFQFSRGDGQAVLESERGFPVLEAGEAGFSTARTDRGERLRVLAVAVEPKHGGERLVLRVVSPLAVVSRIADRVKLGFLVLLVLAAVLGAAGAAVVAHGVLAPMRRLSAQVNAVVPDDRGARIDGAGLGPELGGLANAFNGLLARLAAVFDGQRAFVGRASHALRTPLASILMEADVALRKERDAASYRTALEAIAATTRDAARLADGLLALSRADAASTSEPRARFAVAEVAAELERLFSARCGAKGIELTLDVPAAIQVVATRGRVRELLDALLDNAVRYTPVGGRVAFRARGEAGAVVLEVSDTGPGFAPAERDQAFERFFRGRAAAQSGEPGSGLGLAVVKALAEAEGATLSVADAEGGGAVVRVRFPA